MKAEIKNDMISFERLKSEHIDTLVRIAEEGGLSGMSAAAFEKELENRISYYKIAIYCGTPVGFIGVWNIAGECEVIDIAVDLKFRRRGIASQLMEDVIGFCKDSVIPVIHLEVRESNIAAISLYEKVGFKRVGFREKYYSNGENAVLMSLALSSQ